MLDVIATAISLDQILLGLVGHVANDATAKLSISVIKALGPALFGLLREPAERSPNAKRTATKRRRLRRKARSKTCRCKRQGSQSSRGRSN